MKVIVPLVTKASSVDTDETEPVEHAPDTTSAVCVRQRLQAPLTFVRHVGMMERKLIKKLIWKREPERE